MQKKRFQPPVSSRVMLATDLRYTVAVRITSGTPCVEETPVDTSPSGLTDDEIDLIIDYVYTL